MSQLVLNQDTMGLLNKQYKLMKKWLNDFL